MKSSVGSQGVFKGEGSASLNVTVNELLELLPRGGANLRRDVLIGASVELVVTVVTVEQYGEYRVGLRPLCLLGHQYFAFQPENGIFPLRRMT